MNKKILNFIINVLKLPFMLVLYLVLMLISFVIPSKYPYKIINIEQIEENITMIFNRRSYLKVIALIIAIVVTTIIKLS